MDIIELKPSVPERDGYECAPKVRDESLYDNHYETSVDLTFAPAHTRGERETS